jgi:hypothetical protein
VVAVVALEQQQLQQMVQRSKLVSVVQVHRFHGLTQQCKPRSRWVCGPQVRHTSPVVAVVVPLVQALPAVKVELAAVAQVPR